MNQPLLFFSTGYFIYIGRAVDTVVHEHHALQIAISFEDEIEIVSPGSMIKHRAVIIGSDEPHECRTYNNTFLLINIDPECTIGAGLKKICLSGKKIAALPDAIVEELLEKIKPLLSDITAADSIFNNMLRFLRELSHTGGHKDMDDRIARVLEMLKQPGEAPFKIKDLAAIAYLSPSRLIHLFTTQVGIPVRKYILWARLLKALQYIIDARDLTDAALEAGFSDAPHFNRTFKRMFGIAPSYLLKNSQFIQAFVK
ncbi:helix-turn-helix domain-containing protein [Chitinophaga oryzae]|uniref:Helix-turn-helix domain-containing protein n=1 Tax=Chitinophaga oryzae TaxID=2725414 RepID=A0ABX6LPU9_9BACT|nr:helix-turn-helix domain-containing protein [Chitinophaga oryzae]QJB42074.1 helix-turn-helix domain-containing protein [Chitinophaga oryzae]